MANVQNDNFLLRGKKHLDARRLRLDGTPWTSVLEVNNAFIDNDRVESQVYFIVDREYWYLGGTENENLVEKKAVGTGELISKFTSTVIPTVDDSTIVIPANNTWLFDSVPYTNTVTNVLPFDYAAEGFSYFLTIVATKFNTFVAKVGSQSISNPDEPIIDEENELFLTTYLIYDNYIDVVVPPVSPNIYVEKESFAPLTLISSGHVVSIELDKRNNIIFSGNITKTGNVIKNNPNHFVVGLPFTTTNKTANPIEIQHLNTSGGSGSVAYFNTEELSYFLQPNEVAIWISEILNGQKIHRRVSSYIDRDNVIFRSGTEVGKHIGGDLEVFAGFNLKAKNANEDDFNGVTIDDSTVVIGSRDSPSDYSLIQVDSNGIYIYNNNLFSKGIVSDRLFDKASDPNAFIQLGDIAQLEEDVFDLGLNKADLVGGLVPSSQLPAYVDDILEGYLLGGVFYKEDTHTTVIAGEVGKIYVDLTVGQSSKQYRWTGSAYVAITNGFIASTNDVPEGSNNLYFTTARVLATLLTGISFLTGGAIVSTDSVLVAFGKVQKQLNDFGTALGLKQDTLNEDNFGTFTNSVADKNTQSDTDVLAYVDVTTGKWVKQTFSKLVDYLKGFFVDKTTAQTIDGVKTFTASPIVPDATTNTQSVNLGQLKASKKPVISDVTKYSHTGTTSQTLMTTLPIPAGTIKDGDVWEVTVCTSRDTLNFADVCYMMVKFDSVINGFVRDCSISRLADGVVVVKREITFKGGEMRSLSASGSYYHDYQSLRQYTISSFDPTIAQTLSISFSLTNATNSANLEYVIFKKIN